MRSRYWIVIFCLSIWAGVPLSAGLNQLDSATDLSNSRVAFNFARVSDTAAGGQLFRAWGLSIESADGESPRITGDVLGGQPIAILSNANDGDSSNIPMIVNLSRPARQMGFTLRNGTSTTAATISVFDNLGNQVGQLQIDSITTSFGPFVGFETTEEGESFTKVIIDYGDDANAEQLIDIEITFVETPFFTTFLAQVADGAFGGNFLETTVVVTNLTNTTAQGEIRFIDDAGRPLEMALHDNDTGEGISVTGFGGAVLFPILPFSSRSFTTSAQRSPPVQGYAEIRSDVPVEATAIFRARINGVTFEAGVGGSKPLHRASAAVNRSEPNFDSGIAVANPNDAPVKARMELISDGRVIATNNDFLSLGPGEHVAGFLPTIFPGIPDDLQGAILINSPLPIIITVLRTAQGGIVSSSLPVGGTEQ